MCTDILFETRPSPIAHSMLFEHKSCYLQWDLPGAVFQCGVEPHSGCTHHSGAVAACLTPLRTKSNTVLAPETLHRRWTDWEGGSLFLSLLLQLRGPFVSVPAQDSTFLGETSTRSWSGLRLCAWAREKRRGLRILRFRFCIIRVLGV